MEQISQEHLTPWYRQFWPWFLMALPASAVIAGICTVFIAFMNQDDLVVDNYYKQGLAINQTLRQQQLASDLGLAASADWDRVSNELKLTFSAVNPIDDPVLKLTLVHATMIELDQVVFLKKEKTNSYSATIDNFKSGKWHLILEPVDAQWQIKTTVTLPRSNWILIPDK